jgi:hypothetical protein
MFSFFISNNFSQRLLHIQKDNYGSSSVRKLGFFPLLEHVFLFLSIFLIRLMEGIAVRILLTPPASFLVYSRIDWTDQANRMLLYRTFVGLEALYLMALIFLYFRAKREDNEHKTIESVISLTFAYSLFSFPLRSCNW